MNKYLVFVYNAKGDLFSTVTDFAHKILSPSTYDCRLCALTYGNFSIRDDWKSFIEQLPLTSVFLHKEEFETQYRIQSVLPAIFISSGEFLQQIVSQQQINNCGTLEDLKRLVSHSIEEYV